MKQLDKPTKRSIRVQSIFDMIDKIVNSGLIAEDIKLVILNDIHKMYTDKKYYEKCCAFGGGIHGDDSVAIDMYNHHIFLSSDLGHSFWSSLYEKLYKNSQS